MMNIQEFVSHLFGMVKLLRGLLTFSQNQFVYEPIRSLLIAVGVVGIVLSVFADSIGGHPGFGLEQMSWLIISLLLCVAGILKVHHTRNKILVWPLGVIYVCGILYMCLRPDSFKPAQCMVLLDISKLSYHDFVINIVGFIPLGYLFMLGLGIRQNNRKAFSLAKKAVIVAGAGGVISLVVEISQCYLISGRHSSLIDWIANTLGILIGIAIYIVMEQERTQVKKRKPYWLNSLIVKWLNG